MTGRTWPSRRTRRTLRLTFWRHRRGIRALLTGVTVLCSLQVVAGRTPASDHSSTPGRSHGSDDGAVRTPAPAKDGLVTTVVRFADPGTDLLVTAGSVVDVLAAPAAPLAPEAPVGDGPSAPDAPPGASPLADVVASGVRVVSVPSEPGTAAARGRGARPRGDPDHRTSAGSGRVRAAVAGRPFRGDSPVTVR